jgi:hypothetical protein
VNVFGGEVIALKFPFAGLVAVTMQFAVPVALRFAPLIEQFVPVAANVGAIRPEPPLVVSVIGVPAGPVNTGLEIEIGD